MTTKYICQIAVKIFQMDLKNINILHFKALPNIPKIGDFWYENVPSGNPYFKARLKIWFDYIERPVPNSEESQGPM
jgi:hypothetical protein